MTESHELAPAREGIELLTPAASGTASDTPGRRGRLRLQHGIWGWALVAQGISSVTSFGLSLLAARALGVVSLGIVFAGFTAYLMLLALHRALVTTPLISSSSALGAGERAEVTRKALTTTLVGGAVVGGLAAVVEAIVGGDIGHGLLAFAPWLVPAFAQELFRAALFRDGHGRRAAATNAVWLGTMCAAAPVAVHIGEVWAIVAAWGVGGVVAALLGGIWLRALPFSLSASRSWFVRVAFPFGRWLALQEGSWAIGFYGTIVVLTGILGIADLGGFRAADSLFAPFTLLGPALVLAGLPAVTRALARSRSSAVDVAVRISAGCVLLTVLYAALMIAVGPRLLVAVFGEEFEPYGGLVLPMAAWQIVLAAGIGFTILLRAEQRGKAILAIALAALSVTFVASTALASAAGVEGAVWGFALGHFVGTSLLVYVSLRAYRDAPSRSLRMRAGRSS